METVLSEKVIVGNAMGLHARPAAQLVHIAGKFKAALTVRKSGAPAADCRSVLALLMLAASKDTELEITASGSDAREALDAVVAYFGKNFDEQ